MANFNIVQNFPYSPFGMGPSPFPTGNAFQPPMLGQPPLLPGMIPTTPNYYEMSASPFGGNMMPYGSMGGMSPFGMPNMGFPGSYNTPYTFGSSPYSGYNGIDSSLSQSPIEKMFSMVQNLLDKIMTLRADSDDSIDDDTEVVYDDGDVVIDDGGDDVETDDVDETDTDNDTNTDETEEEEEVDPKTLPYTRINPHPADNQNRSMTGQDLRGQDLSDANFKGAQLSFTPDPNWTSYSGFPPPGIANLMNVHAERADFRDATLEKVNFQGSFLNGAKFKGSYTPAADAVPEQRDSSGQITRWYQPARAASGFHHVNFAFTHLEGADFSQVDAEGLKTCSWNGATYDRTTIFPPGFNPQEHGLVLAGS